MKNIVSVAGGKMAKTSDLPECLDVIAEAGYKYIDFWLCSYSEAADSPMKQDNWKEWVEWVKNLLAERDLSVAQIHCHWRHRNQINEDFTYTFPNKAVRRNVEACRMLGCDRLIFHPIQRWFPFTDESMRRPILDANVEWFRSLLPLAEKFGVELHLENLFNHKHVGSPDDPIFPFSTVEDIMYVVNALDSPLVKVCLDTGHANINGLDVPGMILAFGDKLGSLHLNDNYGKIGPIYEDLHLFPGYAKIDWKSVFAALDKIGYTGSLNMEPGAELDRMPHAVRVIQLRAARETVEAMQDLYTPGD